MQPIFFCYYKCTTCAKARKFLNEHQIAYQERDVITDPPSRKELADWMANSAQPLRKYFNTSGQLYRELQLKERLPNLSKDAILDVLTSSGYLIKRPLLIINNRAYSGFNEKMYRELFKLTD